MCINHSGFIFLCLLFIFINFGWFPICMYSQRKMYSWKCLFIISIWLTLLDLLSNVYLSFFCSLNFKFLKLLLKVLLFKMISLILQPTDSVSWGDLLHFSTGNFYQTPVHLRDFFPCIVLKILKMPQRVINRNTFCTNQIQYNLFNQINIKYFSLELICLW